MTQNEAFKKAKSHILQAERTLFETVTVAVPLNIIQPMGYMYDLFM